MQSFDDCHGRWDMDDDSEETSISIQVGVDDAAVLVNELLRNDQFALKSMHGVLHALSMNKKSSSLSEKLV
jgi:hypothetical protein